MPNGNAVHQPESQSITEVVPRLEAIASIASRRLLGVDGLTEPVCLEAIVGLATRALEALA